MLIIVSQVVEISNFKRRWHDRHLQTLCQWSSRAGYNYQPISESIHKVWTNQKADFLKLALTKSDSLASFANFLS